MILISSAAYVNSEFQTEFGRLPPAFLPVGNKRLFEHQIKTLKNSFPTENFLLSLPESYKLLHKDKMYLDREDIKIVFNDESLSLGASIQRVISIYNFDNTLRLLHGDTFVTNIPSQSDCLGVSETDDEYEWEVESRGCDNDIVWCGYFAFSNVDLLKRSLVMSEGDFVKGISFYSKEKPLKRVNISSWCDFGHINTYFRNRSRFTSERDFNHLTISNGVVWKTSSSDKKIKAEYEWFKNIPDRLRVFTPQLIKYNEKDELSNNSMYGLEYLALPPLNEIFVHGLKPTNFWVKVFKCCDDFFECCRKERIGDNELVRLREDSTRLIEEKTWKRLNEYISKSSYPGIDVKTQINQKDMPSLRAIVSNCINLLDDVPIVPSILHGDFCLSNILFDSRADRIKVIDPRGLRADDSASLIGDLRYDYAKLTHSIIGLYDHILSGAFDLNLFWSDEICKFDFTIHVDDSIKEIQKVFKSYSLPGGILVKDIMPLTVLLFLSMLPLHSDNKNRQDAILANAILLYSTIDPIGDS